MPDHSSYLRPGKRLRIAVKRSDASYSEGCVAEIESTADGRVVLRVLDPAPDGGFDVGATVELAMAGPDGLYRGTTTVERANADEPILLDLRAPEPLQRLQRRVHPRAEVHLELSCRRIRPSAAAVPFRAVAEDLSQGGVRVRTDEPLQAGAVLELEFTLAGDHLALRGMVLTTRPADDGRTIAHIRFSSLPASAAEEVGRFVDAQLQTGATT